jgi:hypothetical protein
LAPAEEARLRAAFEGLRLGDARRGGWWSRAWRRLLSG